MRRAAVLLAVAVCLVPLLAVSNALSAGYTGSKACAECHQKEFESYSKSAKKAHSFQSIQIMASKLSPAELQECYACHTTGYGQPGGFISVEKTPQLANAGCEVCHGPGEAHAQSGDKSLIKSKLSVEQCQACHNEQRVKSFGFKPMLYGGAH
ncbi:cytochrome c family protein [Fundidesulfovibrio agrisoli]|uniref:cytochrome c family protein n=1 Tax=Fundidesulfovibrio agrisoli TaxID=2922717 RepID=UPI001FADF938|nr:cytochrome c family protein [Fundidesulfovibrio agrisoli]